MYVYVHKTDSNSCISKKQFFSPKSVQIEWIL